MAASSALVLASVALLVSRHVVTVRSIYCLGTLSTPTVRVASLQLLELVVLDSVAAAVGSVCAAVVASHDG